MITHKALSGVFQTLSFVQGSPGPFPLISSGFLDLIPMSEALCKTSFKVRALCYLSLPSTLKIQVTVIWFPLAYSLKIFPLIVTVTFFSQQNLLLQNKYLGLFYCFACFSCKYQKKLFFFWKSELSVDSFFSLHSCSLGACTAKGCQSPEAMWLLLTERKEKGSNKEGQKKKSKRINILQQYILAF